MTTTLAAGELEKIILLAANGGGSGKGGSYWTDAATCGMRAILGQEQSDLVKLGKLPPPDTKNHFVVGSVYHALHEFWRANPEILLDYTESFTNPNVAEGMRLFAGWREHWPMDFWGRTVAVEQVLPGPRSEAAVRALFHGEVFNGKPDLVVEVTAADLPRIAERVQLPGPGYYILDWKTADTFSGGDQYRDGIQAVTYPHLWNMEHPEMPVRGIIFDIIEKHSRRKTKQAIVPSDFHAVYVPIQGDLSDVKGLVLMGTFAVENRLKNRAACSSYKDGLCRFFKKGCL